jgi:hypothetical protein
MQEPDPGNAPLLPLGSTRRGKQRGSTSQEGAAIYHSIT